MGIGPEGAIMSERHEEIARCLFRESNDALFIFDTQSHRVVDVNPVALRLTGFERKTIVGKRIWDLFQGREPGLLDQLIEAYQVSWFYHSREGLFLNRSGGGPLPVNVSVSRIHTRPETLGLVVARDISDRKRAQDALDRFFRLAPDLFAVIRPEHGRAKIQRVNPAWETSLGHRLEDLVSTCPWDLIHPEDRRNFVESLERIGAGGEIHGMEVRIRHRHGRYRWISCNAVSAEGLYYLVGRDVTDEKRFHALQRAKENAEMASRAKSELLADIGHEVRTPVAAILEFAEKLIRAERAQSEAPDGRLDDLRTIRRNARLLVRLLNDLLDLTRIESGTSTLQLTDCDVGRLIAEAIDLLRAKAERNGLVLTHRYRTPVPKTVRVDATRLRQIVVNLVSNAIKFTERGSVAVTVSIAEEDAGRTELVVEVADTGPGMAPEVVAQLFRPFFRPAGSSTEGAGLGLAISQRLAGLLGGRITVLSEPGQGSSFTLAIPVQPVEDSAWRDHPPDPGGDTNEWSASDIAAAVSESPRTHCESPEPLQVLVAEDNPDLRFVLSQRLERAGVHVVAVADGERAVEEANRAQDEGRPFDLILVDLRMPGMDGREAARRIRAHRPKDSDGLIVALTASEHAAASDAELFDDHVPKPLEWNRLKALIDARASAAQRRTSNP